MSKEETIKLLIEDLKSYLEAETDAEKDFIKTFILPKLKVLEEKL